jgi:hypothetical protein
MIKVYCIKNEHDGYLFRDLVLDECYDAEIMSNNTHYKITLKEEHCEFRTTAYPIKWFVTQAEWREKQMNSVLEEEQ